MATHMPDRTVSGDGTRSVGRVKQLDGLRAVAVLLVFVHHAFPSSLPGGHVGVDIFFVLSGFLISTILLNEWRQTGRISFRQFYWRRGLRLMPAFMLLLLCVLLVSVPLSREPQERLREAFASLYMMNWFKAFGWCQGGYLSHTWSLAIEEQFYLLWPIILVGLLRCGPVALRGFIVAAIAAVMAWRVALYLGGASVERIYNGFDTRADALLIGCLLASWPRLVMLLSVLWVPAIACIAAVALFVPYSSVLLPCGLFTLTAVASASIIAALVSHPPNAIQRFLAQRIFVELGAISYGFYLWHYYILLLLKHAHANEVIAAGAAFALTIAISFVSFRYVERPLLSYRGPAVWPWQLMRIWIRGLPVAR
ncbi:acyltransferase [Rhodopseudomonas sp. BAL398]|nr:acyltransferase [Rhodopseudomonas sp. BAL398]MDF3812602.1 acyltransferase [Rhodopseudomonas sp. BAL398]